MGKALSHQQLTEIMQRVGTEFRIERGVKRPIKYIDFSYDNRTCDYFHIKLRGWGGWEKSFYTTNEQRELPPIYDRVNEFLETCR